jgi:hypothetical protein
VVREIVTTERNYIRVLQAVLDLYQGPLEAKARAKKKWITEDQVKSIFYQIKGKHHIVPLTLTLERGLSRASANKRMDGCVWMQSFTASTRPSCKSWRSEPTNGLGTKARPSEISSFEWCAARSSTILTALHPLVMRAHMIAFFGVISLSVSTEFLPARLRFVQRQLRQGVAHNQAVQAAEEVQRVP